MSKTCTICATPGPLNLYPSSPIIPGTCTYHCSNICTQCISKSLSADIANKPTYRIGCPSCQIAWDRTVIESHVSEKELEKYDSKVLMQALTSIPEFRICQSPSCKSGQIHEDGDEEPMVTCNECGFRSCYTHLIPWHTGLTCAEYDHRAHRGLKGWWEVRRLERAERKFQRAFGEAAKSCPRCKSLISKDGGCYHMTCTNCSFNFCWNCSADYDRILTDGHKSTCPFYRTEADWHRRSTDDEDSSDTTDDDDRSSIAFDGDILSTHSDSSGDQQSMAFKLNAILKSPFRSHDARSSSSTDLSSSDDTSVLSERPEERLEDDSTTSRHIKTPEKIPSVTPAYTLHAILLLIHLEANRCIQSSSPRQKPRTHRKRSLIAILFPKAPQNAFLAQSIHAQTHILESKNQQPKTSLPLEVDSSPGTAHPSPSPEPKSDNGMSGRGMVSSLERVRTQTRSQKLFELENWDGMRIP
ncbi:aristolochene synthase [Physcia stellaris]|nr:aristolochene synthase [Physcia stellaris]